MAEEKTIWLMVLDYVQSELEASLDPEVIVQQGRRNPKSVLLERDTDRAVFLMRGSESDRNNGILSDRTNVTFFIECWAREDDPNASQVYTKIARLEYNVDEILKLIKRVSGMIATDFQLMDLKVLERRGDNDSQRPFFGTQFEVVVEISDNR